jgi:acyl carrier protein
VPSSADTALWESYVRVLSEISGVPVGSIERDSSIRNDLGLDSLGIVELAVALIEQFEAEGMEKALARVDWKELTAGTAFDRYVSVGEAEAKPKK